MSLRNIVFDLGGVVFARDAAKCSKEFLSFISFISETGTPHFWDEYDRGTVSFDDVVACLCEYRSCDEATCRRMLAEAINKQEEIAATKRLIGELKAAGYRLYVLSNMSREFIDFLRDLPVYESFDGEIVSCELGAIKPEAEIYKALLSTYGLNPSETLFVDDRRTNLDGAEALGIATYLFGRRNPEVSCAELRQMLLGGRPYPLQD